MGFLSLHPPFSPILLAGKPHQLAASRRPPPGPDAPRLSGAIRRPLAPSAPTPPPALQTSTNPLRNLPTSEHLSTSSKGGVSSSGSPPAGSSNPLSNKLWLSSRLSPPPPLPLPPPPPPPLHEAPECDSAAAESSGPDEPTPPAPEFQQKGKIFVGNLPLWIKKNEVAELFRQFGPVKSVILIKGHDDPERNMGYCFVLYGGPTAADSAAKAVEFDGVEFHGRALTVRMDDGRRLQARAEERARWLAGGDEREYRSKWHEERDGACRRFRKVLETEPDNWQAAVSAFEKIKKV
uniref:Pentatricopeptide repeat-containing protein At5g04810, chloroplastic n=1 Tax=Anthurium amnicola TaxID=1678845 RepID=A0A1D1YML4_9ARAE